MRERASLRTRKSPDSLPGTRGRRGAVRADRRPGIRRSFEHRAHPRGEGCDGSAARVQEPRDQATEGKPRGSRDDLNPPSPTGRQRSCSACWVVHQRHPETVHPGELGSCLRRRPSLATGMATRKATRLRVPSVARTARRRRSSEEAAIRLRMRRRMERRRGTVTPGGISSTVGAPEYAPTGGATTTLDGARRRRASLPRAAATR